MFTYMLVWSSDYCSNDLRCEMIRHHGHLGYKYVFPQTLTNGGAKCISLFHTKLQETRQAMESSTGHMVYISSP